MSNTTSSSSPIHFLAKHSFGGGTWGTYWVLAFVVNPDDSISMFHYRNGITGMKANLDRLVAYPIVDHSTGWSKVGTFSREDGRKQYAQHTEKGYKPVNP